MDPLVLLTIIVITLIIAAFFAWFFIHKSKRKERLVLLEKGYALSDLPKKSFPWLKVGCVITSASIGLILGLFLMDSVLELAPFIGMVLFGGIGLIIANYLNNSKDNS